MMTMFQTWAESNELMIHALQLNSRQIPQLRHCAIIHAWPFLAFAALFKIFQCSYSLHWHIHTSFLLNTKILQSFCPTQYNMKLNLATGLLCLLASTEVVAASSWWSKASMLSWVQRSHFAS